MSVTSKIRRQGGAAVLTIPPALLKLLHLDIGSQVTLSVNEGELVARPLNPAHKRYSLAELLDGSEEMTKLNAETEWFREGESVGHELP